MLTLLKPVELRDNILVDGVLKLCAVLIQDQGDGAGRQGGAGPSHYGKDRRGMHPSRTQVDDDSAEEQGWVARMVHLFRSDDLNVQFEVSFRSLSLGSSVLPSPA